MQQLSLKKDIHTKTSRYKVDKKNNLKVDSIF